MFVFRGYSCRGCEFDDGNDGDPRQLRSVPLRCVCAICCKWKLSIEDNKYTELFFMTAVRAWSLGHVVLRCVCILSFGRKLVVMTTPRSSGNTEA